MATISCTKARYEELKKNQYGQYLKDILDGKYIDVLN